MPIPYNEPYEKLSPETRDIHRALTSLVEEIEAVDYYHQRADACEDAELRGILIHNRDEEVEHAMMSLEWLRRTMPVFDEAIRTYLLKEGSITAHEAAATGDAPATQGQGTAISKAPSLGIGSNKL